MDYPSYKPQAPGFYADLGMTSVCYHFRFVPEGPMVSVEYSKYRICSLISLVAAVLVVRWDS